MGEVGGKFKYIKLLENNKMYLTNGALNILKKVAPESAGIGGSGGVNPPVRIRLVPLHGQAPHEAPSIRAG